MIELDEWWEKLPDNDKKEILRHFDKNIKSKWHIGEEQDGGLNIDIDGMPILEHKGFNLITWKDYDQIDYKDLFFPSIVSLFLFIKKNYELYKLDFDKYT